MVYKIFHKGASKTWKGNKSLIWLKKVTHQGETQRNLHNEKRTAPFFPALRMDARQHRWHLHCRGHQQTGTCHFISEKQCQGPCSLDMTGSGSNNKWMQCSQPQHPIVLSETEKKRILKLNWLTLYPMIFELMLRKMEYKKVDLRLSNHSFYLF